MPPKAADAAIAQAAKDANFLATCFKHLKQRPVVDTAAVAAELKLSKGGVDNKLRPIVKAMEEAGAAWLKDQPAANTSNRGGGAKAKAKPAEVHTKNGTAHGEEDGADPDRPQPKARNQKKSLPKSANSASKRGRKAKAGGSDGEDGTNGGAPTGKKTKTTHQASSVDQDEVSEQIKNELGADDVADGILDEGDDDGAGGVMEEVNHEVEQD